MEDSNDKKETSAEWQNHGEISHAKVMPQTDRYRMARAGAVVVSPDGGTYQQLPLLTDTGLSSPFIEIDHLEEQGNLRSR